MRGRLFSFDSRQNACRSLLEHAWIVVFIVTIALRLAFVCSHSYTQVQHDSGPYDSASGHAALVYQTATRGLDSLNIDPMSEWSFYNPPLHYWLAAGVFNFAKLAGLNTNAAMEAVQLLTAFYTAAASLLGVAILRTLGLRGERLSLAASLWCSLPILIPLAGQLSPDALFVLLSLGAIYLSISWFKNPTLPRAAALGLCCGLSVMTKYSGLANFAYPGLAMLLQVVWVRPRLNVRKALLHSAVALGIGTVVGGWWHVRALLVFNMPLGYVQKIDPRDPQNIAAISLARRLFDVSLGLASPFLHFAEAGATDYNLFLSEVKSMLFDELTAKNPWVITCAYTGIGLMIACIVCSVRSMVANTLRQFRTRGTLEGEDGGSSTPLVRWFAVWGLVMYVALAAYLAFSEPFTCSMSFRYIIPFTLFLAYFMAEGEERTLRTRWALVLLLVFVMALFYVRYVPLALGIV